ncbi:MAG: hypothetical protein ABW186_06650, partial [Rhodanobacteraceae bacterium]
QYTPEAGPHNEQIQRIGARGGSYYQVAKSCHAAKGADYSELTNANRAEFASALAFGGLMPPLLLMGAGLPVRWISWGFRRAT